MLTLHLEKSVLMVDANSKHHYFEMCRIMYKTLQIFVVMSVNGSVFLLFVFLDELALAVCTYTASILHLFRAYTFKGTT